MKKKFLKIILFKWTIKLAIIKIKMNASHNPTIPEQRDSATVHLNPLSCLIEKAL